MSVVTWVKSRLGVPQPVGPEKLLRHFTPELDVPIARDGVSEIEGGWRIATRGKRSFRLFEVSDPDVERCIVTYRARMRSEGVQQRAYLEMWCHFPGLGEYFSKGFHNALKGDNEWASYEIPFYLKAGQRPDMIKLNLAFDGPGAVEIRDIELTATPIA
jgi:hypothetical protein